MLNGEINGADNAIIKCTLSDNTEIIFDGENIEENGLTITGSIAGSRSIQIGATVMKVASLNIIDIAGKYKNTDFRKAVFNIDIINSDTTYHKGKYIYYSSTRSNGRIKFELRDYMQRTEKKFNSSVTLPATFGTLMRIVAQECLFTLGFKEFRNSDMKVAAIPEKVTYRNIINYIAQAGGYFAEFNEAGELEFKEYKKNVANPDMTIDNTKYFEPAENITTVTGVAYVIDDSRHLIGSDDYVLELSDNPFVTEDNVDKVLNTLADAVVLMTFYAFNARIHSNVKIELGDMLNIIDYRGNEYPVMVMSLTYAINQNETISGVAQAEEEKETSGTDLLTRIISKTTTAAQKIISTYDKILSNMTELISQGFGMYTSREQLSDGSYINYMHNKPNRSESSVVWKLTSNGLMVSKDGCTSWAVDSNGNALFDVITAHGINSDWLNVDNLNSISGKIGGFTLTDNLVGTAMAYLPPTEDDIKKITEAWKKGTLDSLYAENKWWDLNGDGKVDVMDMSWMKAILWYRKSYSDCAHKKLSRVYIELNPVNPDKAIRIHGTNAWGSDVDYYVGATSSILSKLEANKIRTGAISIDDGNQVSGDSWSSESGISVTKDIKAKGEIYSGYGTSSQLSLTDVNNNINKIRGQAVISVNDRLQTGQSGNKVTIWSLGGKKLSHGFYIVIVSAVIKTSRYTSTLRFYGDASVIASGVTNSQTETVRTMAVGNFGVSGTQSFDFRLVAEGQDAGTTVTVPSYQTYNILVVKVG